MKFSLGRLIVGLGGLSTVAVGLGGYVDDFGAGSIEAQKPDSLDKSSCEEGIEMLALQEGGCRQEYIVCIVGLLEGG
jgi:hypothetical protein